MSYSIKEVFTLSTISVIICECLLGLLSIFVDTFLISRILAASGMSLVQVGLFYLIVYAFMLFAMVGLSYLLKKIRLNYFISIGAVILVALVVIVYFLDDVALLQYLPLLAVLYSLGSAAFWTGHNNLATIAVSSRYQVRFFSVKKTAVTIFKAIAPFALGSSISTMGFQVVAIIMMVCAVLLFLFSMFIKPNKKFDMSYKPFKYMKKIIKGRKENKLIWLTYSCAFFYGFSITTMSILFTFLIFKSFDGSNFALGTVKTIVIGIAILSMIIFTKFYRKRHAGYYTLMPMAFVGVAGIVMLCLTNTYTVLICYFLYDTLAVLTTSISAMRRSGVIRQLSMHKNVLEHNVVYEIALEIGRILSFGLLTIVGLFYSDVLFAIFIGVVLIMLTIYFIYTYVIEKKLVEQDIQWKKEHAIN